MAAKKKAPAKRKAPAKKKAAVKRNPQKRGATRAMPKKPQYVIIAMEKNSPNIVGFFAGKYTRDYMHPIWTKNEKSAYKFDKHSDAVVIGNALSVVMDSNGHDVRIAVKPLPAKK